VDLPLLLLASALWSAGIAAQGPRWAALLGKGPGAARAALAVFGTNALTVTLPGPSGEALLAAWCERDLGIPWATGASAKLLSRLLGLAVLGLLLLLVGSMVVGGGTTLPAGALALAVGLAALTSYRAGGARLRRILAAGIARLPANPRARPPSSVGGARRPPNPRDAPDSQARPPLAPRLLTILDDALAPRQGNAGAWARATLWSLVSVVLMGLGGYTSALAAGVAPSPGTYAWMHLVTSVAGLVAFVIPAGLGPVDALWVALFALSNLEPADGFAAALAWRQMQALSLLLSIGPLVWVGKRTSLPRG
jgi:uncharacterized membrane protein YbhN (UPF0104 family)